MKNERFFREKRWYALLLGAVPIGIIVGLAALAFVACIRFGTLGLWTMLAGALGILHATETPWFILGATSVGGLLVGLCTALFRGGGEVHLLQELQQEGHIAYRKVPGTLLTALVSLVFGASVGPEGPLLELGAGIGSFLSDRLRQPVEQARVLTYTAASAVFGAFFDSPFGSAFLALELPHAQDMRFYRLLFPGIVASIMTYGLFLFLAGGTLGGEFVFPPYQGFRLLYLLYAFPLGVVGAGAGLLFIYLFREIHYLMRPLEHHPVVRGIIGGTAFGLISMHFPLILFSGEQQLETLLRTGLNLGVFTLLLLGLLKIVVTCLCLNTGFFGGRIFPSFFAGGAIGMAIYLLFPAIPLVVCMLCVLSALAVSIMKIPVSMTLIVGALIQPGLAPVIAIAIIVSFLMTVNIPLLPERAEQQRSLLLTLLERLRTRSGSASED
ncbi:H+/Cl- antiporter ClcA [Thermosporothrix hazakensis]|jgi:H+/Cl- antiporter ClcA|uniref:H+/Cl-antiporter ClcA n=1 Tax=Thermosporothrix hazakensis TaxID=644383 RepID=A0A326U2X9_THEHA|nr:chloride channel protein [Thermosporothrix hazakensis]PZW26132.1 H+/Cl- antiporter ClcA [Thermosporothrix hazakensis]GCE51391.1 chloride channel [Thermosporothrix hazakensis]